ncbi:nuclease-related domain-containing protein [Psychrobacillus vulpis]|uniref:nuclease-related domain-containing protein n=1 Tax=Psychrobacillus vulpis TaxID=2325572 RepID=UPI001F0E14AF|nr:nuclease-related domain-containing protein [Psychrobacillus vulpis]
MKRHHALLKRLPDVHKDLHYLREEIRKMEAGSRGENRILKKLAEVRLPGQIKIFSDVRLELGDWKVQIDCLLVTDRCCIILESKNFSDDLFIDTDSEEFYKIDKKGEEISLPNPYFQLMKHIRFIKAYFQKELPNWNVIGAVIMTAKSCRIRKKPIHYPFYQLESMNEKVIQMYNQSNSPPLSSKQLQTIEQVILTEQFTFSYPPLCEFYRISPTELIAGVECPYCGVLGMKRNGKTWTCPSCKKNARDAHIQTVQEYFWLIKNEITNKEFRDFCKLDSIYSASRMLKNMNLHAHKGGAWRYYSPQ